MNLSVSLSGSSIDAAIKALETYAAGLPQKVDGAVGSVMEEGLLTAQQTVASYPQPYATGQLANSFSLNHSASSWALRNDSDHAAFFEFGTGIKGARSSYPYEFPVSWTYDVNGHGEAGWEYYGDDGQLHWTQGLPSRPFMAPAAARIRQALVPTVRRALRW